MKIGEKKLTAESKKSGIKLLLVLIWFAVKLIKIISLLIDGEELDARCS
jgi:hypothetical protein